MEWLEARNWPVWFRFVLVVAVLALIGWWV